MTLKFKRAVLPAVGSLLVFVALAEWLLRLMPLPHRRLQFMIAGTAATAAVLGTVFGWVMMRKDG